MPKWRELKGFATMTTGNYIKIPTIITIEKY